MSLIVFCAGVSLSCYNGIPHCYADAAMQFKYEDQRLTMSRFTPPSTSPSSARAWLVSKTLRTLESAVTASLSTSSFCFASSFSCRLLILSCCGISGLVAYRNSGAVRGWNRETTTCGLFAPKEWNCDVISVLPGERPCFNLVETVLLRLSGIDRVAVVRSRSVGVRSIVGGLLSPQGW